MTEDGAEGGIAVSVKTDEGVAHAPSGAALARASALNLLARLISGAAVFGLAVLTTNVLDTHDRGIYVILTTWAGIGATVITGGTTVLAADLIHHRHSERTLHGATTAIAVGAAVVLLPLSIALALATSSVTTAALVLTAALTVLVTYSGFEMAIAQAHGNILVVSVTDIAMALFPLIATGAAAVLLDPTVTTLVGAWTAGALVTAAVQFARALGNGSYLIVVRDTPRGASCAARPASRSPTGPRCSARGSMSSSSPPSCRPARRACTRSPWRSRPTCCSSRVHC